MELSFEQIAGAGLVAVVLAQVIHALVARKVKIPPKVVIGIVFGLSVILAYIWFPPKVSFSADPFQVASDILAAAAYIFMVATLIYKIILKRVFEEFGWELPSDTAPRLNSPQQNE